MSKAQEQGSEMSMIEVAGEGNVKLATSTELSGKREKSVEDTDIGRDMNEESRPKIPSKDNTTSKPILSQGKEMADTTHQLRQQLKKLESSHSDLLADFRDVERENREQSLELRDLRKKIAVLQDVKRQNVQLKDDLRARNEMTDTHREQIRKERQELIEQLHLRDDVVAQLQNEILKRKSHMDFLTMQTREANEEKANLELANQKLTKRNKALSENLTECKDDLLRLQPPTQMSDSEISEQFSNLLQQISRWVDDETEDSQMLEFQFENAAAKTDELPELLRKYIRSDHLRLAKKYPNAQPLILRYIIQCYLDDCIFGDDIHFFGLDSSTTEVLRGIEQGMERLEPQRDAITIRHWRSETLNAILHLDRFRDEQRRQAIVISQSLHNSLSYLLPQIEGKKEGWKDLYDQFVFPAIHVSMSIRMSTSDYRITSRILKASEHGTMVFINDFKRCEMMDILSHKFIRPDSVQKVAEDGRIGEQMLVVQPALLRDQKESNGSVLLCKPTLLVRLDEPMGRRNRGTIKAFSSWLKGDGGD